MPEYFLPNKLGRIAFMALEEVLGHTGMNAVLNLANLSGLIGNPPPSDMEKKIPFGHLAGMQSALEQLYGPRGGRGVALRVGRAVFRYGLREFSGLGGVSDLSFRLKPQEVRLRDGGEILTNFFNRHTDQRVRLEEKTDHFLWYVERCPLCWQRRTDRPACHLTVGLLQESLHWATGGKYFQVTETACIGSGDSTCTLRVDKNPIE